MYVNTDLQPHSIFLLIFLTLSWSLATWLSLQNKKLHCELLPQYNALSKYGLAIGTAVMILNLWFLSIFYDELMFAMTIIFSSIMIGMGTYLARYFEWIVFIQNNKDNNWENKLKLYFYNNYGNGLGPRSTEKILKSMIPIWWIKLLPSQMQFQINKTLDDISLESEKYALKKEKKTNLNYF